MRLRGQGALVGLQGHCLVIEDPTDLGGGM